MAVLGPPIQQMMLAIYCGMIEALSWHFEKRERMKRIQYKVTVILGILILLLTACGQSQEVRWQEQYDLGVRYLSEGNYEEAIIAFTAAIEIDPKRAEAYVGRGDAYVLSENAVENLSAALEDYETAISLDESQSEVYSKMAEIFILQGDRDAAIAILEQGYQNTGDETLREKIEEIQAETIERMPGDWGTYAPTNYMDIPLDVTILSSDGVQPRGKSSHRIEVYNGRCSYTISRHDGAATKIIFGSIGITFEAWSDNGSYMLSGMGASTPEEWQSDLSRVCPLSYTDSSWYRSQIEDNTALEYEELYHEAVTTHYGFNSGNMMNANTWCLILAAYDSSGTRVGYTVYQINNTAEIKAACSVSVNEETGEILS